MPRRRPRPPDHRRHRGAAATPGAGGPDPQARGGARQHRGGCRIVDAEGRGAPVNDGLLRLYGFPRELGAPGTPLAAFVEHRLATGFRPRPEGEEESDAALVERRVRELPGGRVADAYEEEADGRTVLVRRERLPDGLRRLELRRRHRAEAPRARERAPRHRGRAGGRLGRGRRRRLPPDLRQPGVHRASPAGAARRRSGRTGAELLRGDRHDAAFFAALESAIERGRDLAAAAW